MNGEIKENVTRRSIWLRFCFMIIMCAAFGVAEVIVFAVIVFQFLSSLFTGKTNDQLIRLGRNLARYLQQITAYLTFATEEIPFPFMSWPDEPHEAVAEDDEGPPADLPHDDDGLFEDDEAEEEDKARTDAQTLPLDEKSDEPANQPENVRDIKVEEKPVDTQTGGEGDSAAEEKTEQPDDRQETVTESTEEKDSPVETKPAESKPADASQTAVFADGDAYQKFMGERSRLGGEKFAALLDLPNRLSWLDVGCGTGAFSAVILDKCDPVALIGIDRSEEQIALAKSELASAHADFRVGDATRLPFEADSFDVAVSSYVLNFVPERQKMMDEMARVVRPEGTVAISVFDVVGGRQSSHQAWELIRKRDADFHAAEFEKRGWNITTPDALKTFFEDAGLEDVSVDSIEIHETYDDFDDYWNTMTSMSTSGVTLFVDGLAQQDRDAFKEELKSLVPAEADGRIELKSGSWVVRGKVPA